MGASGLLGTGVEAGAPEPPRDQLEITAILHALSDPVRLQIVARLSDGSEYTCGSIELPVTKSTCTHHFRVLRAAGVIRTRQEGTCRFNSLRREDLDLRFPGLVEAVLQGAVVQAVPVVAGALDASV